MREKEYSSAISSHFKEARIAHFPSSHLPFKGISVGVWIEQTKLMLKISKSSTILPACIPTLNIRHYNNSQREEPVSYLYLVRCTLSVRDFPGLSQNTATFKHTGHGLVRRMLSVLFINLPGLFFHTSAHITSPSTCCVLLWMTQTPPTSLNMSHTGTYCNHWVKKKNPNKHKKTCLSNIRLQHCEVLRWKKIAWRHPVALKVLISSESHKPEITLCFLWPAFSSHTAEAAEVWWLPSYMSDNRLRYAQTEMMVPCVILWRAQPQ